MRSARVATVACKHAFVDKLLVSTRSRYARRVIDLNSDLSCFSLLFSRSQIPCFAIKVQYSAADCLITRPTLHRTSRRDKSRSRVIYARVRAIVLRHAFYFVTSMFRRHKKTRNEDATGSSATTTISR